MPRKIHPDICNTQTSGLCFLLTVAAFANSSKEQADAPKTCKADNGIDDTADDSIAATKEPCYQVKTENAHKAPVKRTDDGKNKRKSIHRIYLHCYLGTIILPMDFENMRFQYKQVNQLLQKSKIAVIMV